MPHNHDRIRAIQWRDDQLFLLDQRILPAQEIYLPFNEVGAVAQAIADMVVRGAPAIGITAAYGFVLAARNRLARGGDWRKGLQQDSAILAAARPTAVNLFWAIKRMQDRLEKLPDNEVVSGLLAEAQAIHEEDIAGNYHMGELGAKVIAADPRGGSAVLTHCNTGSLATGGYGTALGVIRSAYRSSLINHVYADETRPWLQGSRLTAWELVQDQIPVDLLADGAAAWRMRQGQVGWVIVGSDRIAANGDVANKIGTYSAAVAARHHGLGFMVVAPTTTIDLSVACGADIPIETRDPAELLRCGSNTIAAPDAGAWNPVFDVTPAELVDVIVTERGVVHRPTRAKIAALFEAQPA